MKLIFISFLIILGSFSCGKKKPSKPGSFPPISKEVGVGKTVQELEIEAQAELVEPLDTYLSIGAYLQKELDKVDNTGKVYKVYLQLRQENSITRNFDILKSALLPANPNIAEPVEAARKANFSTVELDVDITSLKSSLAVINKAVGAIEISMGSLPAN